MKLGRGKVISARDIAQCRGDYPVYSAAQSANGEFGKYGKYAFDEELITWSVDGGGKFFYRPKHRFSITNVSGFIRILEPSKLDYKYLYYTLADQWSRQNFNYINKAHPSNIRDLYKIALIPLVEQRHIADKLDKVFAEIGKSTKTISENKKRASKIVLSELLTVFRDEKLKAYPLEEVCDTTSGGTPKRSNRDFYEGKIVWLKSGELNDNRKIISSQEHISKLALENSNAKMLSSGTILMAMYGATIGKLGILQTEATTNQAVCAITPHKNILKEYMYWYLYFYRSELVKQAFGGAQPNISQTLIRQIPVRVPITEGKPDLQKQKEIVTKVNAIQEKTQKLTGLLSVQEKSFVSLRSSVLNQSFQIQT